MPNYDRKLASVQKILKISPIPNADVIEVAKVLGWDVVIKKGEFKEGDLAVYFEIDSFLPIEEKFEFLRSSSYKKNDVVGEGFRLRTVKMRGQISQGLLLPLSLFELKKSDVKEGQDLTKELKVKLFEVPEGDAFQGKIIGIFHHRISKTNEIRIQSNPEFLNQLKGHPYYITEKIDGTSTTIVKENGEISIFGHRSKIDINGSVFVSLLKNQGVWDKLIDCPIDIAIQGEYFGNGIQKNKLKVKEGRDFRFFNLVNPTTGDVYSFEDWDKVLVESGLKEVLKPVKILETGESFEYRLEELLEKAKGNYDNAGRREGIVVRPQKEILVNGERLSFKVLNNDFLLKEEE